ncbi:hypothetical protein KR059_005991 [Drosophila kikkawai]|nr:hypothetical protein KR059_005991 [Drosophila kikkawai]
MSLEDTFHLQTEITSAEDIDDAAFILEENVKAAAELAEPPTVVSSKLRRPTLPPEIKELIDTKHRLRRQYSRTHESEVLRTYRRLAHRVRKLLKRLDQGLYENELEEATPEWDTAELETYWQE